jgi:hypothetical protein
MTVSILYGCPATHRLKHYGSARVHEDCYCHKCDIIFDDEEDLDEVGYYTNISRLTHFYRQHIRDSEEHSYCCRCEEEFDDDDDLEEVNCVLQGLTLYHADLAIESIT